MKNPAKPIFFAILAAALYAVSSPLSKLLLSHISAAMMAGLLYLGAGMGIYILGQVQKTAGKGSCELPLTAKELPYIIAMILLDIAAPIFLMLSLTLTTAANVSLLNNFEIAATALVALIVFKESIGKRLWGSIFCVTLACILLSFEDIKSLSFSWGSLLVILACICWGFENNCTRMLSTKNPMQIVVIKGFGSGIGSLLVALLSGTYAFEVKYLFPALLLGFVAYGLSIYFYIYAQRSLGAARTSAYYATAPFIGAALSLVMFKELPSVLFVTALCIMLLGTWLNCICEAPT